MGDRDEVLNVILEHALKYRQTSLVQVVQQQTTGSRLPDIFHVILLLDRIYTTRNVGQFELTARLIEAVYETDHRVCPFRLYSKLLLGLKMKVLLECLRKNDLDIEAKLNKSLPEGTAEASEMTCKEDIDYQDSVKSFRDFFIPLMEDKVSRGNYFLEEYETEYGNDCVECIMKLLNSFILQIISHLPATKLEMLFSQRFERISFPGNKELQALLNFLQGIMILTEEDLIRFLDVLSKKKNDAQTKKHVPDVAKSSDMNSTVRLGTFESMDSSVDMCFLTHSDTIKGSEGKFTSLKEIEMDKISNQFAISTDTEVNYTLGEPTENVASSVMKSKRLNNPTNSKRNKTAGIEMDQVSFSKHSSRSLRKRYDEHNSSQTCTEYFAEKQNIPIKDKSGKSIEESEIDIQSKIKKLEANKRDKRKRQHVDKKYEIERLEKNANRKSETNLFLDRNDIPEKWEYYKGGQIERCKLGIKDRKENQNSNGKFKIEVHGVDQDMKPENLLTDKSKQMGDGKIYEKESNESRLSRTPKKHSNENFNMEQVSPVIHEIKTKEKYNEMKNQVPEVDTLHKEQKQFYGMNEKPLRAKRQISYVDDEENQIVKKAKPSDATQIPDSSETYPSLSHQHYIESQTPINKHMSLQVHTDGHSQSVRILDNLDNDMEEFLFVPPSTKDSESDIELEDLADEVCFRDALHPEANLPSLERFRITSPVKLCIVKLFGKTGGLFS